MFLLRLVCLLDGALCGVEATGVAVLPPYMLLTVTGSLGP